MADDKDKQGFSWDDEDKKGAAAPQSGGFVFDDEHPDPYAQAKANVAKPTEFEAKRGTTEQFPSHGSRMASKDTAPDPNRGFGAHVVDWMKAQGPPEPKTLGEAASLGLQEGLKVFKPSESPAGQVVKMVTGTIPQEYFGARERGHDVPYSTVAGLSSATGIRPAQMERAAESGDTGGVLGEAAVPTALATAGLVHATGAGGKLAEITGPLRETVASKVVAPLARKPPVATMKDLRFGVNPGKAIATEGLVAGSREGLVDQINGRIGELSGQLDKQLQNHSNAQNIIDAEPIIDKAIDSGIKEARKVGSQAEVDRLENLRVALKTEHGPIKGTPFEINQFKRSIGDSASDRGAFKATDPVESSIASVMSDIYGDTKNLVNKEIPEGKPINERIADLIGARAGVNRNIALHINKSPFSVLGPSHMAAKALEATVGSTPVRTGVARLINAGNVKGLPEVANTPRPLQPATPPQVTPPTPPSPVSLRQAARAPQEGPTPLSTVRPLAGAQAAALAPIERSFAKPAPPHFENVLKDTGWEYGGKNSMGLHEFKEPKTNISITVKDADLSPDKVRERIASKLKEFGRAPHPAGKS